jgi:spermidine synthase
MVGSASDSPLPSAVIVELIVHDSKRLLYILFFFSGASALIYQVVWIRMFGLVFGVSAFATATVLTSFMAGLGFGSFCFGKIASRSRDPLRLYAFLELCIGLFGLIFPFLYSALKVLCIHLPGDVQSSFLKMTAVRFALSLLVLTVPTVLMGGTLPVLSRIFVRDLRTIGRRIGHLYAVNNAGAVAGCLAAGFIVILLAGVRGTVYVAAGMNIGIAFLAWRMRRTSTAQTPSAETVLHVAVPAPPDSVFFSTPLAGLVLLLIFIEGFVSLAYELVWTRILSASVLGNSVYSFCIVAAVFILGLSLGSYITAAIIDKRKDALGFFATIEIGIGLTAIVFLLLFSRFPAMDHFLLPNAAFGVWGGTIARDLLLSVVIMLVPATLMGMAFPTAVKIFTRTVNGAAARVGIVGGVNIAGSILGSFSGGFILISALGMYRSVIVLAFVNILAGVAAILADPLLRWRYRAAFAAVVCAASAGMPALLPHHTLFWRSTTATHLNEWLQYYVEDYAATVAVVKTQTADGMVKCLEVDGIPVAGTDFMLRTTQKVQAHIPLLLYESQNAGRAKKVLTVGLGSGGTSWSATRHDGCRVTCVELVPGVAKAAACEFTEENFGVFGNARYRLIIGDGRNHVLATRERYDAILTESVHPVYAGNASLYTQDYFAACRLRLTDNGIFSVWLPIYRISLTDFKTVMATFLTVFPHASVWFTPNSLSRQVLLIGTMKELRIDVARWNAMVRAPGVASDLAEVRLDDPVKLLDCMIMSEEDMKVFSAGAALHTDDRPVLEFSAPKSADDVMTWKQNLAAIAFYKRSRFDICIHDTDSSQTRRSMARCDSADRHVLAGILNHVDNQRVAIGEYRVAQSLNPSDGSIAYLAHDVRRSALDKVHHFQSSGSVAEASALYGALLGAYPEDFDLVDKAARWYGSLRRVDSAEALLLGFLMRHPRNAGAYAGLGIVYVNNQQWDKALAALDSALALDPRSAETYNTRAIAYAGKGLYGEALSNVNRAIEIDPTTPNVYENRSCVYTLMSAETNAASLRLISHKR